MMHGPPYRVGVIGIGFGQRVHVPAFRMDPRFEVRAVCASSLERAREVASRLAISNAHGDWRALVGDREIDVVSIATPPTLQVEILEAVIDARKPIFLEKPVGGGARRAAGLAKRAREASLATIVDFEFEAIDVWIEARKLLRDGLLGDLRHVEVSWNVETYAQREKLTSSWKLDAERGGGTLNSFVSHSFRYLEWLIGPVAELQARFHPNARADEVVHLWMKTGSGLPISLVASSNSHHRSSHEIAIHGEKGFLVLANHTPDYVSGFTLTIHRDPMSSAETRRSGLADHARGDGRVYAAARMVRRLGDAIELGRAEEPGLREGARVEALIDAAKLSDREGRSVGLEA